MEIIRCQKLINPGEPVRTSVRMQIEHGVVTDISDVPSDEKSSIDPIAVLPRLINAHTHLEFSDIRQPLGPATPFPDWIRSVIAYRNDGQPSAGECVRAGLREVAQSGTSFVGEICTSDAAANELQRSESIAAVCFRELLSFSADRVADQIQIARSFLKQSFRQNVTPGLSPHAPYTVHPELFHQSIDLAAEQQVPVAMHLAESPAEIEMLQQRSGPMVQFLSQLNLWADTTLGSIRSVMPYLERLAELPRSFAVHCNYLSPEEQEFLCDNPQVAIVYCPRTHHYFEHPTHDWQALSSKGATVVLGTDSRASNPDLDLLKDVQLVANQSGLALQDVLPLATTAAAASFGLPADEYRIRVGGPAHLFQVPIDTLN